MTDRETMIDGIRHGLRRPDEGLRRDPEVRPEGQPQLQGVMPPIASEALLPKFEEELRKVAGSTCRASTASELEDLLRGILASSHAKVVMLSRNLLLRRLRLAETIRAWGNTVSLWPEAGSAGEGESARLRKLAAASFSADVGITGVDFALAETGTLVLSSLTEGAQLASLAPPVHVALFRRGQLIASLEEVLEKVSVGRDRNLPSPGRSVVFITGTSRTADIEQILVRGVHGPREVHAILVEESCL